MASRPAIVSAATPEQRDPARDAGLLDSLGASLASKRRKAIDARMNAGIDQRWFEDVEAYEGRDELTRYYLGLRQVVEGYVSSQDPKFQKNRSTVIVNVTRSKVNTSSARLQDIALPTDDRNWALRPSTVPDLVAKMGRKDVGLVLNGKPIMVTDNGAQRQATVADHAKMDMDEAKKTAAAMQDEIDDQLDLSNDGAGFEGVVRQVIDDHELLGVGVIKGPIITSRVKRVWMPVSDGQRTAHVLQRIQDMKPGSSRVNPWDVYPHPDCGENPKKFPVWERLPGVTAGDLRRLADIPGYLSEQIKRVLIEGPRRIEQPANKPGENPSVTADTIYDAWEYHGELSRDELMAAGCPCGDDVWAGFSAAVVMVNNTVIKADIELLDSGEMPYDFYVSNRCSGSWAGYGVSFLSRSAQKVITAGWRTMMDNAGQVVGPQIVINRTKIEPAVENDWSLRGMKLWFAKGDVDDVGKAFAVHEINAHQSEYAAIIKMGMEFLDQETAIPQLAQGEQGQATDVLGGMNLLLNASNVVTRRKLKAFDDQVTIPHIGRYVDWNMQYNPKNEIKGDFEVQARASGALMDMEIQNKMAGQLLGIAANPAFAHGMKKWDAVRRVVRSFRFDPSDFVKTDDEIKVIEDQQAKSGPPPDPRIQVEQMKEQHESQLTRMKQDFESAQNERDRENERVVAAINERLQTAELTSGERQNLEKIKATIGVKAMELDTQQKITRHNQLVDLHKHNSGMQADVIQNPAAEPAGRAPAGQAFSR